MQVGPDPYVKQRRWWPILLRMARQLYWTWWVLSGLGLLSKSSPLSRWLERRFVEVEHGLRCLLIIKASGFRRFGPGGAKPESDERPHVSSKGDPTIDDPTDDILSPQSGYRRLAFSLTLSGFDRTLQQRPPILGYAGPAGRSSPHKGPPDLYVRSRGPASNSPASGGREGRGCFDAREPSSSIYGGSGPDGVEGGTEVQSIVSPSDQFTQRLAAIESAFNDADGYAVRIAKNVYARGGRLVRLIAEQLTDTGFTLDPGWPQSVDAGPQPIPILDSS